MWGKKKIGALRGMRGVGIPLPAATHPASLPPKKLAKSESRHAAQLLPTPRAHGKLFFLSFV